MKRESDLSFIRVNSKIRLFVFLNLTATVVLQHKLQSIFSQKQGIALGRSSEIGGGEENYLALSEKNIDLLARNKIDKHQTN